jgi:hypothetical protein
MGEYPYMNPAKILKAFIVSELVLSRRRSECLSVDKRGVNISSQGRAQFGYFVMTMTKLTSYIARKRLGQRSKYCFLKESLGGTRQRSWLLHNATSRRSRVRFPMRRSDF